MNEAVWNQWPKDRPRPSVEQMDRAQERYKKEGEESIKSGYYGDFYFSLDFAMATYNYDIWKYLFDD